MYLRHGPSVTQVLLTFTSLRRRIGWTVRHFMGLACTPYTTDKQASKLHLLKFNYLLDCTISDLSRTRQLLENISRHTFLTPFLINCSWLFLTFIMRDGLILSVHRRTTRL